MSEKVKAATLADLFVVEGQILRIGECIHYSVSYSDEHVPSFDRGKSFNYIHHPFTFFSFFYSEPMETTTRRERNNEETQSVVIVGEIHR